jgi:putative FmdB family regulatory protein
MPTYEYACKGCGEHLEVVQSFKDDPLTTCPTCAGELRKVFSAAGLIFKGSGWHVKDYANAKRPGGSSSSSGDESGAKDKSATKGEGASKSESSSSNPTSASTTSSPDAKSA